MIKATCMHCGEIDDCHLVDDIGFVCGNCRPLFLPRNVDKLFEQWANESPPTAGESNV